MIAGWMWGFSQTSPWDYDIVRSIHEAKESYGSEGGIGTRIRPSGVGSGGRWVSTGTRRS
jgi:hypothetical protein